MPAFQVGHRYDVSPLPHSPEHTTCFPAGAITLAVEYRSIDNEMLAEAFGAANLDDENHNFDDDGVSLHVFDAYGAEYLRFDCFDNDPHYHYITPGSHQCVVAYDRPAFGDMLTWALSALETRIPEMLEYTSAPDLAARVDSAAVAAALAELAPLARETQERHRAARAA